MLRYPEVLAHYYSLINIHLPKEFDPPVLAGLVPPPAPAPPPPAQQPNNATAAAAAAGGVPPGFHMGMNGLGGIGIPGVGMAPLQRPVPSRAASNGKKSSQASKRMSKKERDVEDDLWHQLYTTGEKKDPATPGPASAAGATHQTRRRDSVRSAPVPPPGVPMPPMFPGKRPGL